MIRNRQRLRGSLLLRCQQSLLVPRWEVRWGGGKGMLERSWGSLKMKTADNP